MSDRKKRRKGELVIYDDVDCHLDDLQPEPEIESGPPSRITLSDGSVWELADPEPPAESERRQVCSFCGVVQVGAPPLHHNLMTTAYLCESTAKSVERLVQYFAMRGPFVLIGQEAKLLADRCREICDRMEGEKAATSAQLNTIHAAAHDALQSASEALVRSAVRPEIEELGWVIVRRYFSGGPDVLRYVQRLRGTPYGTQYIGADWTENPARALRFAREHDANVVCDSFNLGTRPTDMRVEQHMWTDVGRPAAPPAPEGQ